MEAAKKKSLKKFVCEMAMYIFQIPLLDVDGKQVMEGDAYGNNKLRKYKEFRFTAIPPKKNKDGLYDRTERYCFFDCEEEKLGEDYDAIVKLLEKLCKNPNFTKMYTKKDFDKRRNPEAFAISEKLAAKDAELSAKDAEIKALNDKLYGKK